MFTWTHGDPTPHRKSILIILALLKIDLRLGFISYKLAELLQYHDTNFVQRDDPIAK
jgi:hypothetical protein